MKIVIIFAVTLMVLQQGEARPHRLKRSIANEVEAEACVRRLNLDQEEINEISNRDIAPENDGHYIKFMKCYWQEKGYLHQDGTINSNAIRQMIIDIFQEDFTPEFSIGVADTVMGNCENIQGSSAGQKAIRMENCVLKGLRDLIDD